MSDMCREIVLLDTLSLSQNKNNRVIIFKQMVKNILNQTLNKNYCNTFEALLFQIKLQQFLKCVEKHTFQQLPGTPRVCMCNIYL